MTIFQATQGKLLPFEPTTFADAGFREREQLQQLLKNHIDVISQDTLIISEEFGDWADSRRRIDLLGLDRDANLVVIELKRTEDGGHMDLQSVRYAAMVSALTFDEAVDAFQSYLARIGSSEDARSRMLEFLDWEDADAEEFPRDVRIVLAAAEFSKEITTSVLWLNDHGIDVKCVRLRPYKDAGRVLIDVQQVIPLPEAEDYQIRIRDKRVVERATRSQSRDFTRFDVTIAGKTYGDLPKRRAAFHVIKRLCDAGVDPEEIRSLVTWKGNVLYPIAGTHDEAAFEPLLAASLKASGNLPQTRRFFTGNDELIHANGKTYAISKMWGTRTVKTIEALLAKFTGHSISYTKSE